MKYVLALAVVGCLCAIYAQGSSIRDEEGFYFENRERLGHFKSHPFTQLYNIYAVAFVKPKHPERPADDFRNYLPSADECMVFLRRYRIDEYKLRDVDDVVLLDACLGYLYEAQDYHQRDKDHSKQVAANLDAFINDEKLSAQYQGTKIDEIDGAAKDCVGNLLLHAVQAKHQFHDVDCNNHWLDLFNNFAACHTSIPQELRQEDSYISVVYELVRQRARRCFDNEIKTLNAAVRESYANNPFQRVKKSVTRFWNKIDKQARNRIYPDEIASLLEAVQGTKKELNLRQVAMIVRGVSRDEQVFKDKLLNNMAAFADATIKPNPRDKDSARDPTGELRYNELVDKMCLFFRSSDNPDFYDFATPFVRMVRMLSFPEVFDISEKEFVTKVLNEARETSALYLCVSSCNLLTFTEGQFVYKPQNGPHNYRVVFKPDTTDMVRWPDAGFY